MFSLEEQKEIQLFLSLLFAWDVENKDLWKCVAWTFTTEEGEKKFANYGAQSLEDMCRLISTRAGRQGADLYIALGTMRTASVEKKTVDGFPKASRVIKNIVSVKSLFLDVDVGKEGAYATTEDAVLAVEDMCVTLGLPIPTFKIQSGSGGLHVYWVFDRPVPLENWVPLAKALQAAALGYKLKFDPQVTVDACRILRVPNTQNHKLTPPGKVRMLWTDPPALPQYSYQQMTSALAQWIDGRADIRAQNATNQQQSRNARFKAGVSEGTAPPVSIDDVAANCAALDDILGRGGNGDAEPLWNLAMLAASFTTDPHEAAHALGDQDPRYTHDGTEKKLAEKITARANNPKLGWPKCQEFSVLHPACATCPLLVQQKSPFHHARRPDPVAPTTADFIPAGDDALMPEGYWRHRHTSQVFTTMTDRQGNPHTVLAINYPVHDGGIDADTGDLRLEVTISGARRWLQVAVSDCMQPAQAAGALAKGNGVFLPSKSHAAARDFLVAWVSHLQNLKRYVNQSTYGWADDGKTFAFGDQLFHEDGSVETVFRGRHHNKTFMPVGELKPWQDAMQLIYGNMPLEITVATAFAAPLVELISPYSLIVSLYSRQSGIGKTTAMMLGQSVWGNPRTGMSALSDTTNATMKKTSDLKNLPNYWDELHTRDQLDKVIDIVFQVTQGKAKSRMQRDATLAEVAAFTTMFVIASNHGISDAVYSQTESTEAGGLRIFEIEALSLTPTMPGHEARQLVIPLQHNYGVAGAAYSQWLAQNRDNVDKLLGIIGDELEGKYKFGSKERFWSITMASLIVGATLANVCGLARFDIPGIRAYLDVVLGEQRGEMKVQEYATMAAAQDVKSLLQEMMSNTRNKNLIITETIPYASNVGRPMPLQLVDTDMSKINDPWIWWGRKDKRVRARVRPFNEWLRERRLNPKQIVEALKGHYHVTQTKQTIGAGVQGLDALASFGRYACYDFTPLTSPAPSPDSGEPN